MGNWPLFRFDEVSVSTTEGSRLVDLSVEIADGTLTLLLGPSGAGKSTMLRLCNRLTAPTSGRVCFRGQDVATLDPLEHRRRVGMVFQRPTLFAGSVADNLREAADLSDAALGEMLQRVGLEASMLDRVARDLSGGEAQRVCLGRTLLTGPEVLLMDEPTASLDPDRRVGIERLAVDLVGDGLSMVWVTHDLDQASRLGGTPVVLLDGRVATEGEAERFLSSGPGRAGDGS